MSVPKFQIAAELADLQLVAELTDVDVLISLKPAQHAAVNPACKQVAGLPSARTSLSASSQHAAQLIRLGVRCWTAQRAHPGLSKQLQPDHLQGLTHEANWTCL